jgi:hypothetical protein
LNRLITITALALALSATNVQAANFTCGRWLCRHLGIANCGSLALALQWAEKFRHTTAHPGAVLVQRRSGRALGGSAGGHVSKVVALTDKPCRVIVQDNRGRYERDHCRNFVAFVSPQGMWTE